MSIFLAILKIIGIIILIVLCLILLGFLAFLFVPVRYRGEASYRDEISARLQFHWLFHLIGGYISYQEGKVSYLFRFLWFKLLSSGSKKKKDKKNKKKRHKKKKSSQKHKNNETKNTIQQQNTDQQKQDESDKTDALKQEKTNELDANEQIEAKEQSSENEVNISFWDRLKLLFKKLKEQFVDIKYTIRKFCDKIIDIRDDIAYYLDALQSENTKIVFGKVKKQFFRIYKNMKPKKFSLYAHLGFQDEPELLGKILAIHGLLYPFHNGKIKIEPDFEGNEKYGSLYIKGRISTYIYLRILYLFMFDKDVKECKRVFAKEED